MKHEKDKIRNKQIKRKKRGRNKTTRREMTRSIKVSLHKSKYY